MTSPLLPAPIPTAPAWQKNRWKNVGSVVETKDGGKVILIDRSFNPAGIPVEPGRDQIMISMFKPKTDETSTGTASTPATSGPIDDDIPF